jgi:hypothetical protein
MRRVGFICLCLLALAAAGCGGSSADGYSLKATQSCFAKAGYATSELPNRYLPGSQGNLRVRLLKGPELLQPSAQGRTSLGYVFLVFGKDQKEAQATQAKAVHLTVISLHANGRLITASQARRSVGLTKNVFFYSATGALTAQQRAKVAGCLA